MMGTNSSAHGFVWCRPLMRREAFTLVELLVVMAIISILAGLLLPALSRAVEAARGTACMGCQRQIGVGIDFYADECADWIPPLAIDAVFKPYKFWHNYSLVEQGYIETVLDPPGKSNADWAQTAVTKGLFSCPSESAPQTANGAGWFKTNYGLNRNLSYGPCATMTKRGQVTLPSQTCMIGDAGGDRSGGWYLYYKIAIPDLRHSGKWNLLYCDSHVGTLSSFPPVYVDTLWLADQ